jgi:hypothetical protein
MGPTSCVSCMGMALNGGNKNAETLSHDPLLSPPTARLPWPTAHQTPAPRAAVAHAATEPGFGAGVQDRGCWGSGCATEPKGRGSGEAASRRRRWAPGGGAEVAGAAEPGGGGRPVGGGGGGGVVAGEVSGGCGRGRWWRRRDPPEPGVEEAAGATALQRLAVAAEAGGDGGDGSRRS